MVLGGDEWDGNCIANKGRSWNLPTCFEYRFNISFITFILCWYGGFFISLVNVFTYIYIWLNREYKKGGNVVAKQPIGQEENPWSLVWLYIVLPKNCLTIKMTVVCLTRTLTYSEPIMRYFVVQSLRDYKQCKHFPHRCKLTNLILHLIVFHTSPAFTRSTIGLHEPVSQYEQSIPVSWFWMMLLL